MLVSFYSYIFLIPFYTLTFLVLSLRYCRHKILYSTLCLRVWRHLWIIPEEYLFTSFYKYFFKQAHLLTNIMILKHFCLLELFPFFCRFKSRTSIMLSFIMFLCGDCFLIECLANQKEIAEKWRMWSRMQSYVSFPEKDEEELDAWSSLLQSPETLTTLYDLL